MHRRLPSAILNVEPMKREEHLSLSEKWRLHLREKKKQGSATVVLTSIMRFVMLFQALTELYVFKQHIFPYLCEDCSEMTKYYLNVFLWFIVVNMLANWLCVTLYDPSPYNNKDNPDFDVSSYNGAPAEHFIPRLQQNSPKAEQNGIQSNGAERTASDTVSWHYCEICSMQVPYRAHHCLICKKCVLKRDHHCYMIGNCIGFRNQRYFIILSFYIAVDSTFCGILTLSYVKDCVWPELGSWTDFVLPVTIWQCVFGNLKVLHGVLIYHLYIEIFFGLTAFVYFNTQMVSSAEGKTMYEVVKKIPIRNSNSFNRNLKSVFGDLWALNFLFPMTPILPQRDDGIHWEGIKLSHKVNN